ncbi:MAG: histidine triad nucleotide-binding protein [Gammaproteobacteria bacterium]|uniref:histidine triad nucleotide-binding protein n=1 Tax=Methyloprofundus sp. TaxID=2020875 RepID=UPI0017F128B6|nr:histidine triad nucleotide-binding protein [Methyloprofundus sp.]MBT3813384.1 histidine triad nucleotide-binding protein [Gammaproteobacteria bacterium]HIL78472.1 histidine triad nucleotide-binding protein [Methylococcales bacterium]MBT4145488.1 histidine triad nucleotide-binding protein [Gammaproteobacteria bacterium]MBT5222288.1 histidine triad nucleotide-binding protein [Gammaproteobacteria bacterium]MBT5825496.1 histidine triad nucleotide-binding protein [Gammaproteobacteria bacterium]
MTDCLFCKMVAKEIEPDVVYEDEQVLAFRDIHPKAPTHILIIPKQHVATLNDLQGEQLAGHLLQTVAQIAKSEGIAETGYRTVINCNNAGGQEVYHLHLHLLGGRQMSWPAG